MTPKGDTTGGKRVPTIIQAKSFSSARTANGNKRLGKEADREVQLLPLLSDRGDAVSVVARLRLTAVTIPC